MKAGDLVFIKGSAKYSYTKPGSWGYVLGKSNDFLERTDVQFRYYARGDVAYVEPSNEEIWAIHDVDLLVLPEPPPTPEEITALVYSLTRLTR